MTSYLGDYELVRLLARGGMCDVFLGRHARTAREVALKVLDAELAATPGGRAMFRDEARLGALFVHPNLAAVYEHAIDDGVAYTAMEYVDGIDLHRLVRACGPLPFDAAIAIAIAAAAGLDHAHRTCGADGLPLGVVHRDVSPSNVMVTHDGGVKVIDFGVALARGSSYRWSADQVCGKPSYMAPEQCLGYAVDVRSDVFSLGAVLYELAVGRPCFVGEHKDDRMRAIVTGCFIAPRVLRPEIPRALEHVIATALALGPESRFASAAEMRAALERIGGRADAGAIARVVREFERADVPACDATPTIVDRSAASDRAALANGRAGGTSMNLRITSLLFALAACAGQVDHSPGSVSIRVAHLSPDAPNVDFCIAPHGTTTFTGPILSSNGHLTGLPYAHTTKYFQVDANRYDVRLVAPGLTSCDAALGGLPDFTDLPELAPGTSATIAAEGLVAFGNATPLVLAAYVDDTAVDANKAKLRFVHASPGTPPVDVGLGGGALFTSVFSDIAYGGTAAADNGYLTTDPIVGAEISARPHGTFADAIAIKPASLAAGAIATAFAVGIVGDANTPLRVLLCDDNAPPTGLLTPCTLVGGTPERAHVRIAHLSPDTPPVDVCVAPAGTGAFTSALLKTLGADDGLAYPQVTTYVDLPVAAYDIRIVHATASDCSIGAVPDATDISVADGLVATIAALGVLDPSGAAASNPSLHLAVFVDDTSVTSGKTKVRFIHASPGTPAVDVGLGSGSSFVKVFADVAFGQTASADAADNGFVETTPVTSPIAARLANQSSDALVVSSVALDANAITTAFAIGGKTGASTNALAVLLCADNAPASGLYASCAVAQ